MSGKRRRVHQAGTVSAVDTMVDIREALQEQLQGSYKVGRELGHGGMATVYQAHDLRRARDVAIKVLNPELSATIGVERFQREISLVSQLHDPHILGLYESGTANGLLYYTMPFVNGESLRDRLNREGPLPLREIGRIVMEVASALDAAHAQGIVHRDVKPENILLDADGHALVTDFGIARAATDGFDERLTQRGIVMGTPAYMSPEQSAGEYVGASADVYSLGCMLFEMLAGHPPFVGKNAIAIMAQHALDTVPSVRDERPSVPREMEAAIYAALEKSPLERPTSTAAFADMVTAAIAKSEQPRARWYDSPAALVGVLVTLIAAAALLWTLFESS